MTLERVTAWVAILALVLAVVDIYRNGIRL